MYTGPGYEVYKISGHTNFLTFKYLTTINGNVSSSYNTVFNEDQGHLSWTRDGITMKLLMKENDGAVSLKNKNLIIDAIRPNRMELMDELTVNEWEEYNPNKFGVVQMRGSEKRFNIDNLNKLMDYGIIDCYSQLFTLKSHLEQIQLSKSLNSIMGSPSHFTSGEHHPLHDTQSLSHFTDSTEDLDRASTEHIDVTYIKDFQSGNVFGLRLGQFHECKFEIIKSKIEKVAEIKTFSCANNEVSGGTPSMIHIYLTQSNEGATCNLWVHVPWASTTLVSEETIRFNTSMSGASGDCVNSIAVRKLNGGSFEVKSDMSGMTIRGDGLIETNRGADRAALVDIVTEESIEMLYTSPVGFNITDCIYLESNSTISALVKSFGDNSLVMSSDTPGLIKGRVFNVKEGNNVLNSPILKSFDDKANNLSVCSTKECKYCNFKAKNIEEFNKLTQVKVLSGYKEMAIDSWSRYTDHGNYDYTWEWILTLVLIFIAFVVFLSVSAFLIAVIIKLVWPLNMILNLVISPLRFVSSKLMSWFGLKGEKESVSSGESLSSVRPI